jgi:hypothetical protein
LSAARGNVPQIKRSRSGWALELKKELTASFSHSFSQPVRLAIRATTSEQPVGPWLTDLRDNDVLGRGSEIARKHQSGAAEDDNIQPRVGGDGCLSNLIEGSE